MAERKKPKYQDVDGVKIVQMFSPECFREALNYKPRSDDVFIVTYPKCGTTWTQTIVLYIFRKGVPMENQKEFFTLCPFLELSGAESAINMKRPGAIKTHLSFKIQPYSPDAKFIYVVRNPKDCCVSFYYHTKSFPGYSFEDGTFDDFFELFIEGEVDYGDYFEHVLSWYEHRNDPNVLFLTYEEMKKDTKGCVMQMAKFMGKEYGDLLENDPTVLDNIVHYSSFQYMKKHFSGAMNLLNGEITSEAVKDLPLPKGVKHIIKFLEDLHISDPPKNVEFIRKGVVGDWRSHFSPEQSKRLDDLFEKKLGHTHLFELWKEDMKWH